MITVVCLSKNREGIQETASTSIKNAPPHRRTDNPKNQNDVHDRTSSKQTRAHRILSIRQSQLSRPHVPRRRFCLPTTAPPLPTPHLLSRPHDRFTLRYSIGGERSKRSVCRHMSSRRFRPMRLVTPHRTKPLVSAPGMVYICAYAMIHETRLPQSADTNKCPSVSSQLRLSLTKSTPLSPAAPQAPPADDLARR